MKIIFDSEEQMDRFCKFLADFGCPNDVDLGNVSDNINDCERCGLCSDCWKDCGIEMEVKESE